jgi:sec-independent protein translocase protein TatC
MTAYERSYKFGQRARNTVFLAVLAWFVGAGSGFWWHEDIFTVLIKPAGGLLSPFGGKPIALAAQDPFSSTLELSKNAGNIAAAPVLIVGALSMLKAYVPTKWWLFITFYSTWAVAAFVTGNAFVYFVMMPVSMKFLLTFASTVVTPTVTLINYMDLMLSLLFWLGLAFEIPMLMNLLAKFNLFGYPLLMKFRKWWIPTAFIFAALITPSLDGTLTFFVAIPMLLLYEIGLLLAWVEHTEEGNYPVDLANDIKTAAIYIAIIFLGAAIGIVVSLVNLVLTLTGIKWAYKKAKYFLRKHGIVS